MAISFSIPTIALPPRSRGSTTRNPRFCQWKSASPALAGIDPYTVPFLRRRSGFPRARGDRPWFCIRHLRHGVLPPRSRGSTQIGRGLHVEVDASPALAGIDRHLAIQIDRPLGFPRARGDRPDSIVVSDDLSALPPRSRGSTQRGEGAALRKLASPALAGIDFYKRHAFSRPGGFPRARGDRP